MLQRSLREVSFEGCCSSFPKPFNALKPGEPLSLSVAVSPSLQQIQLQLQPRKPPSREAFIGNVSRRAFRPTRKPFA